MQWQRNGGFIKVMLDTPLSSEFSDAEFSNSEFGFSGVFCMCRHTLAFKKVITTNVIDKLEGVRFYSFSATTDNEVLSTPFYYSNPKLYTVIGS